MKKLKYLLLFVAVLLVIPFGVYADEAKEEVKVYLFRGEGCPHCQEAEEWFKSIEDELGNKFEVVDYETWYNEENANLMQQVAKARGETAEGVPYIIIGDMSWNGFDSSYEEDMKEKINQLYDQNADERYDIMKYVSLGAGKDSKKEEKKSSDVLSLILIIIVTGGIGFGIYQARKHTN